MAWTASVEYYSEKPTSKTGRMCIETMDHKLKCKPRKMVYSLREVLMDGDGVRDSGVTCK